MQCIHTMNTMNNAVVLFNSIEMVNYNSYALYITLQCCIIIISNNIEKVVLTTNTKHTRNKSSCAFRRLHLLNKNRSYMPTIEQHAVIWLSVQTLT